MIQYSLHQLSYLDVAKHYYKIWETPSIKEDEAGKGRQVSQDFLLNELEYTDQIVLGSRIYRLLYSSRSPW